MNLNLHPEDFTDYKAVTADTAILKLQRLMKKTSHSMFSHGDNLMRAARHLTDPVEYDKFMQYLVNPQMWSFSKGERIVDPILPQKDVKQVSTSVDNGRIRYIHVTAADQEDSSSDEKADA